MEYNVHGIYHSDTHSNFLTDKGRQLFFLSQESARTYCIIHPKNIYSQQLLLEYDETKHKIAGIK